MHDIRWIRDNAAEFDQALNRRPLDLESQKKFSSANLLAIDASRREAIQKLETLQARRNSASKEIGEAKKRKDLAHADDLMIEVSQLKSAIPELEKTPRELEAKLNHLLAQIPNLPLAEVPSGRDETGNIIYRAPDAEGVPKRREYSFRPKQHFELGEALGLMDFETAAKLSGSRFVVLKGGLARLERALGQLMLDIHTEEHGYTEVNPPLLVSDNTMFGTAQLPKFRDDQFPTKIQDFAQPNEFEAKPSNTPGVPHFEFLGPRREMFERYVADRGGTINVALANPTIVDGKISGVTPFIEKTLWLIPTAEVSLTNLVRESVVDPSTLPMRLTACTPCFRAEAGAAGKDTRGMIRQHQFTKVELVSITTPEQSKAEHERMLASAEAVLQKLDLHYRVITLCTGDMGFASQKTYDIEVWLPGQHAYREISSCSICGEFQARRMMARYRGPDGKPAFVHTLNGSGVAVGRALIAVMETYQQADGSIVVPDALAPYMGGMKAIERLR